MVASVLCVCTHVGGLSRVCSFVFGCASGGLVQRLCSFFWFFKYSCPVDRSVGDVLDISVDISFEVIEDAVLW